MLHLQAGFLERVLLKSADKYHVSRYFSDKAEFKGLSKNPSTYALYTLGA